MILNFKVGYTGRQLLKPALDFTTTACQYKNYQKSKLFLLPIF